MFLFLLEYTCECGLIFHWKDVVPFTNAYLMDNPGSKDIIIAGTMNTIGMNRDFAFASAVLIIYCIRVCGIF